MFLELLSLLVHFIYRRHNYQFSFLFSVLIFAGLQPVLFVSCMRALTAMTSVPVPSLATASLLWINSLVEADPYRLLPFLSGVVIGTNIYLSIKMNTAAMASNFLVK